MTPPRFGIRAVDAAIAVWSLLWLVAAIVVYDSVRQLEEGGKAVVTASVGLRETSAALRRAGSGLHETSDVMSSLSALPFVPGNPGAAVERTADDVDRIAARVRTTARDARRTGLVAQDSARTLAVVLALAVALAPTVPLALMYFLLRPLVAQRLRTM